MLCKSVFMALWPRLEIACALRQRSALLGRSAAHTSLDPRPAGLVYKLHMLRRPAIFCGFVICAVFGCNEQRADHAKTTEAAAAERARQAEAKDPELQDALGQKLAEAARTSAPDWQKQDKLWRGQLATHERQGLLAVLVYGHCYRFVGVGGTGVADLDLALFDPHGVEVQRDVTQQASAALGVDSPICPTQAGAYRVDVHMREGAGSFAVGLYRDLP
jgi:hypothetical protein